MKPQKQLQLSHAHNSRCFTRASRSAHTNKSNCLRGGGGGGVQQISMLIYSVLHNHTNYKRGGGGEDISDKKYRFSKIKMAGAGARIWLPNIENFFASLEDECHSSVE